MSVIVGGVKAIADFTYTKKIPWLSKQLPVKTKQ